MGKTAIEILQAIKILDENLHFFYFKFITVYKHKLLLCKVVNFTLFFIVILILYFICLNKFKKQCFKVIVIILKLCLKTKQYLLIKENI